MKKTILQIWILLSFQIIFSQKYAKNVEIKWTKQIISEKVFVIDDIITHDNTGYYTKTLKSFSRNKFIQHYDNNFSLDKSRVIELGKGKDKRRIFKLFGLTNKLYMITTNINKKNKKNTLFVETFDKETLKQNNDRRKIEEIDFKNAIKRHNGSFRMKFSNDSSKIVIYKQIPYSKLQDNSIIMFDIFDNQMNMIWQKKVSLPYSNNLFQILDFTIDNEGNVSFVSKIYKNICRNEVNKKVNYTIKIFHYPFKSDKQFKYKVDLNNHFLDELELISDNNNNIICAGFFSDKHTLFGRLNWSRNKREINGIHVLKINTKLGKKVYEKHEFFSKELVSQYLDKKQKKKMAKALSKGEHFGLEQYKLTEIRLKSDGGLYMIGECITPEYGLGTEIGGGASRNILNRFYHNSNVVVVNIASTGDIVWAHQIPKKQNLSSCSIYFNKSDAYTSMLFNDKIYLLYKDNVKNLTSNINKEGKIYGLKNCKNTTLVLASFDKKGNLLREIIKKPKVFDICISSHLSKQIDYNTMVIYGVGGKKHRFAKLIFKN